MSDAPEIGGAALEDDDRITGLEQGFQQVAAEKAGGAPVRRRVGVSGQGRIMRLG